MRKESALEGQFCHFPSTEHQFYLYDRQKERGRAGERGSFNHLENSRMRKGDLDFLVFPHQDGGNDLTGFGSVEESVFEREQVGTCYMTQKKNPEYKQFNSAIFR